MADNRQLSFDLRGESTLKVHLRGTWRLRGGLPSAAQLAELWARWIVSDNAKKPLVVKESFLSQQARDKSTEGSVAAMSER